MTRNERGDSEEALKDFDEAIRLKPDYAIAFYYRGQTRQNTGDIEGARQDSNDAVRLGYEPAK